MDGRAAATPASQRRRMAGRSKVMLAIAVAAVSGIAGILVVTTAAGQAKTPRQPQAAARNFTAAQLGRPGHSVSLGALAGQPVIINFFASWCGPCRRETPMLAQFYRAHHQSVLVIGVDSNDQSSAALKFIAAEGVGYPVAFDPSAAVALSYGVQALPQTFFLNAQHKVVRHIFGDLTVAELTAWAASLAGHPTG